MCSSFTSLLDYSSTRAGMNRCLVCVLRLPRHIQGHAESLNSTLCVHLCGFAREKKTSPLRRNGNVTNLVRQTDNLLSQQSDDNIHEDLVVLSWESFTGAS